MKRANENLFSCKTFKKNLRAYIDNELPGHLKAEFIAHASQCRLCNDALNNMEKVIRILSNLEPVVTSQDFNISLKTRILLEKERLLNPFYRFSLLLREKIGYFLAVPALALVFIAAVFLYPGLNDSFIRGNALHDSIPSDQSQKGADLASTEGKNPDEIVYVYYVLETVPSPDDNIIPNDNIINSLSGGEEPDERVQSSNNFITVSF